MKRFFILFFYSFHVTSQIDISTIKIPKSINETSGLEFFENYLITHNDSGDKPKLYIINKLGKKIKTPSNYHPLSKSQENLFQFFKK